MNSVNADSVKMTQWLELGRGGGFVLNALSLIKIAQLKIKSSGMAIAFAVN